MRPKHLVAILVLLALTLPASAVHAGGVVSVCDEAHLKSALTGGGTVNFSCSGTITLTSTITISKNTTIDGSGQSVSISGNQAVGVFKVNAGITLTLNRLTILNGLASSDSGGAVHNYGTLNIHESTFYFNRANNRGGAIQNEVGATLVVGQSTFNQNSTNYGGAIENLGTATVYNSTFINNFGSWGGAIDNTGALTVVNSTFSDNLAGSGASIYGDSPVLLQNTILVGKKWNGGCAGFITDGGGNLSYADPTCPGINADPALGSLQDNGGLTQTMALGVGSAAIDAGIDAICAASPVNNRDQRGAVRPVSAHCDIGAVEQGAPTLPRPISVAIDVKPGSDPNAINCRNARGVIAVAVLTTDTFDATSVDHRTVTFEGATETHVNRGTGEPRRHEEDVDGDGDTDLVFHFRLDSTGLTCDSALALLLGETVTGQPIWGGDSVRMVGGG